MNPGFGDIVRCCNEQIGREKRSPKILTVKSCDYGDEESVNGEEEPWIRWHRRMLRRRDWEGEGDTYLNGGRRRWEGSVEKMSLGFSGVVGCCDRSIERKKAKSI
ncbi:hypothetical protein ACLOJK_028963 [Asimina triloba]